MSITANIALVNERIVAAALRAGRNPDEITLMAVSKTFPPELIREAYAAGLRVFGENRVQEFAGKANALRDLPGAEWHLIGHLQTNKVKLIVPFVRMIQSVDSSKLLMVINNEAEKVSTVIDCLLQIHIAREESKFGFAMNEITAMLASPWFGSMKNVRISGVMGMATYTDNTETVRNEFRYLKSCFEHLKSEYFKSSVSFKEISMGMSGDFRIAVEEGSTMVRIGSLIFGERVIVSTKDL